MSLVRALRRVLHAHVPRHNTAEPVVIGGAYGLSAIMVHSPVGSAVVACAYASVAGLAALDARRDRRQATVQPEPAEPCYGRHAACDLD